MRRLAFAVPGDLATPTGGYAYDRRMIEELRALGWQVDVIGLGDGFPHPSAEQRAFAQSRLENAPADCPVVIDGLALGVLPEAAAKLAARSPLVALVHHPLALETGIAPDTAQKLHDSERAALATARAVIVTSPSIATLLAEDYDVPPELITVACPGTDRGTPASGSTDGIMRLIAVGSVVPRKGFDVLIEALSTLAELPWQLTVAGDLTRDGASAAQLEADIGRHKLVGRIELLGAVAPERLAALYSAADLFVLASRFEGYGMAFAEAMAHGLPIVGTTAGAIPDTVPPSAGILVEPNDVRALSRTLRMLIENRKEREWLAAGAREAAEKLPAWADSAKLIGAAIEALAMAKR